MLLNAEQQIAREEARLIILSQRVTDLETALDWMRENKNKIEPKSLKKDDDLWK